MKAFANMKSEFLKIIRTRTLLIAIIGVMIIPVLYSATYLWAFWDPYAHLDRMPVAIVNNDNGARYNGEQLTIGKDLVDNLKEKKTFNWDFVSESKAKHGLKNQDYYLMIEIPEDFSKNATTLQSTNPQKLNLVYTVNEGNNYLSSKIGDSAIEKIKEEVAASVTKTYAESMFDSLKDVADGVKKASDGAGELYNGIAEAKDGTGSLAEGIATADSGAEKLANGAKSVDSGAKTIKQKLETLAAKSVAFSDGVVSASNGSEQVHNGLQQFNTVLTQMKDGNTKLLAGANQAEAGTKQLSDGLASAEGSLPELEKGSKQLAEGSSQLSTSLEQWGAGAVKAKSGADSVNLGLKQLLDQVTAMSDSTIDPAEKEKLINSLNQLSEGNQQVVSGVGDLAKSAGQIEQGSDSLADGADQLNEGQQRLAKGINQLSGGAKQLVNGQGQITQGLAQFGANLDEAQKGFSQIESGSSSLTTGLGQLASSSVLMKDGTDKLAQGAAQLTTGTTSLYMSETDLKNGMTSLASGSTDLKDGMAKLTDSSKELSNQLSDGAKDASDVKANNSVYDMFAKPVNVKDYKMNQVPNYGSGLAPYFLALSLFVGALMLSVIFPMFNPATEPKSGISWFLGKAGVILAVGIAQALIADAVLLMGLGLEVKSVPYFIMFSIFTSWTFMAIIHFLVAVLDNPGRFIAVIILILQLTSSAGTFPIELSPKFLQTINHYLPMSYSVSGFRAIISTGDFGFMWENIAHIAIFLALFLAATLTFFIAKFKRQQGHLYLQEQ
ncbi:YhgE/Pip domain-containing protein [Paenibacillus sp. BSR1-1]|uniref:YhgE/Pip domain-containing protein n=1 Tax=Paenibacillus sp. BSR1-1 TaxID=3020845 RepID=UPI0025B2421E|nr:YhgE/Pip domain-containing protein [Paenibacillus sp. BSR1-1]MDN3014588.1 YhgE/Pip domain-containing protein [Paenibacillus sp. BSR1-1]